MSAEQWGRRPRRAMVRRHATVTSHQVRFRMKVLLTESQIQAGVERLAAEIAAHYGDRPLTIVAVMTGGIVFVADLIRRLNMPLRLAVVRARSYRGEATTPGELAIDDESMLDVAGREVLVVDDIFDTGNTLFELLSRMDELRPASVRSCVLLRKSGRRRVNIAPDHAAFDIPDEFVVGYGLDYQDLHRNLPFVAALEPHEFGASVKT